MNIKFKLSLSILLLTLIDLISKKLAIKYLSEWDLFLIFWSKLKLVFNEWIAFSIPLKWFMQIFITIIVLFVLIYYSRKNWDFKKSLTILVTSLIISWALWNLYERILLWKVTDFISVFPWYPTFNLADSYVFIWVVLILFFEEKFKKLPK